MSGLELFLDGGTTVTTVVTGVLGALGYKQQKRDSRDLASSEELQQLQAALQRAHAEVCDSHGKLTDAWQGPLSLFSSREAASAAGRGVPAWAIACARKGRSLVDRAAELEDLADVYKAQVDIALREGSSGKGLLRAPPEHLVASLGDLAQRLSVHAPFMQAARAAFDAPAEAPQDVELDEGCAAGTGTQDSGGSFPSLASETDAELLPIAILRNRGRLGELWRLQGEKMGKIFASRAGGESATDALLPDEVRSKLIEVQSSDEYEAMAAAWALGRLADPATRGDGHGPELQALVQKAATGALSRVLSGSRRSPREGVRRAALESLARIASPDAVSALRELQLSGEETASCKDLAGQLLSGLEGRGSGAGEARGAAPDARGASGAERLTTDA